MSLRAVCPVRVSGLCLSVLALLCAQRVRVCVCVRYWIKGEMAGKAIPTPILIREMKQLLE